MHQDMPKSSAALIPVPEAECKLLLLLGGAALIPRKGKTPQLLLFFGIRASHQQHHTHWLVQKFFQMGDKCSALL